MKNFIRFLVALVLGAIAIDYHGIQPEFYTNWLLSGDEYAYIATALLISWLTMPLIESHFE